jgi:hypothetical protein
MYFVKAQPDKIQLPETLYAVTGPDGVSVIGVFVDLQSAAAFAATNSAFLVVPGSLSG